MNSAEVFNVLIRVLNIDNGGWFEANESDFERCKGAIENLMNLGYFDDDPNSIYSSFWNMGAGEESETHEYFNKDIASYIIVRDILNDIFDRI